MVNQDVRTSCACCGKAVVRCDSNSTQSGVVHLCKGTYIISYSSEPEPKQKLVKQKNEFIEKIIAKQRKSW